MEKKQYYEITVFLIDRKTFISTFFNSFPAICLPWLKNLFTNRSINHKRQRDGIEKKREVRFGKS
ncbi:hypothetical protein V1478_017556 [Vespula squamosa]|uniref:Uncharacterized protein n=1 Tax=Vespula squamosa TaxID=30214 RepID=A0ABD1ZX76_VESSQ